MTPTIQATAKLTFRPGDMDAVRHGPWHESNCALARLLAHHRQVLGKALAEAMKIRRGINDLAPSMTALCRQTCRYCPNPCCISNTVWFDFCDLLFFHLLDAPIPACQAASDPGEACPFLGHHGCRLPQHIRPWMCIQYICPTQRSALKKTGSAAEASLLAVIEKIDGQRFRMEAEVVRQIRRRKRTWPSSSSACFR